MDVQDDVHAPVRHLSRSSAGYSSQQRRPAQAAIRLPPSETPNSLTNAAVADSDRRQTPSGFSWSESQTGLVKTADVQGGAADANGFLVDGPFSVKPASGFSWSETQTGFADSAGGHSGPTATRTGTQSPRYVTE